MSRSIFIFLNIVVHFLIIVSKNASGAEFAPLQTVRIFALGHGNDTINAIFQDDFEKASLSAWKQISDWEISPDGKISGQASLRHSSLAKSGISSIFCSLKTDWNVYDPEWSFTLKNGNWDPSSSNRFWFYLGADTIKPEMISGWAVGVNISGSADLLELWRIKNGKPDSLIIRTDLDWNASTQATIHVRRTSRGGWSLAYQLPGENVSQTFSGVGKTQFAITNLGLYFNYTSTRAGQLWMDDVSVLLHPAEFFIGQVSLLSSNKVSIKFNRPVNPASVQSRNFRLTDENKQEIPVVQASLDENDSGTLIIQFGQTIATELWLTISGVADLSGKTMDTETKVVSYSYLPGPETVLISEVLFNPFSGGVDFVELVNVSKASVPVHRLQLATRNDTLALKQVYPVSAENRFLKPGEYLVCTKDPQLLASQYIVCDPAGFCPMKLFPTYPDDAGTVVLLNDSLDIVDEFSYSAKMHSPFLADEEGVSLERISLEKPANDRTNWASATASVGFATPGLPNSQTSSETEIQDEIVPEPKVFSPNGDGYNDQLAIKFRFSKPGYIANVRIFDAIGRQVRFLVRNQSLAQEGNWLWDGRSESGQKLNIGVYIILVEIFDQEGHTKIFKKTCTLTDRLD